MGMLLSEGRRYRLAKACSRDRSRTPLTCKYGTVATPEAGYLIHNLKAFGS